MLSFDITTSSPEAITMLNHIWYEIYPMINNVNPEVIRIIDHILPEINPLINNVSSRLIELDRSLREITPIYIMQQGFNGLFSLMPSLSSLIPDVSSVKPVNLMENFVSIVPQLKQQASSVVQQVNVIHHFDINFWHSLHFMQSNPLYSYALNFFYSIPHNFRNEFYLAVGLGAILFFIAKTLGVIVVGIRSFIASTQGAIFATILYFNDNASSWISSCIDSLKKPLSNLNSDNIIELISTITPSVILILIAFPSFKLLYLMNDVNDPNMTVSAECHQWYWNYEYSDFLDYEGELINFDSYIIPKGEGADIYGILPYDNPGIETTGGKRKFSDDSYELEKTYKKVKESVTTSSGAQGNGDGAGDGDGDGDGDKDRNGKDDSPEGYDVVLTPEAREALYARIMHYRNVIWNALEDLTAQRDLLNSRGENMAHYRRFVRYFDDLRDNLEHIGEHLIRGFIPEESWPRFFESDNRIGGINTFTLEDHAFLNNRLQRGNVITESAINNLEQLTQSLTELNSDPDNITLRNRYLENYRTLRRIMTENPNNIEPLIDDIRRM
jgi:hypothetical protein